MNITGSDKINVNNNSSNHTSRVVPIDLLPVNEKHLTEDRLKKTIKYKYLFDDSNNINNEGR